MSLTIELAPEVERRLREIAERSGQTPAAFVQEAVEARLAAEADAIDAQRQRNQAAIELLRKWRSEPPDEEDAAWPEFQQALDADHPGPRRLFSE